MQTLSDLLTHELQDLYSAEQQILQTLPKMADAAKSQELKSGFKNHISETQNQAKRLEEIAQNIGIDIAGKVCKGMRGLIQEGEDILNENREPSMVRDAALIATAQRIEHYGIAGYGCAKTYAEQLGKQDIADKLDQTLKEEYTTDEKLTTLAESSVNKQAIH